jgi:hypothetical protein
VAKENTLNKKDTWFDITKRRFFGKKNKEKEFFPSEQNAIDTLCWIYRYYKLCANAPEEALELWKAFILRYSF